MSADGFSQFEDLDYGETVRGLRAGEKLLRRYTLKRIVGRGGMGVVWLAFDEVLERDIAFKFLPDTVSHDKGALDELKRETRRSLELTHPNIIRIYDFVSDANCAGITMEFVDGSSLANLRTEQPNKIFEVADLQGWVLQLGQALEYAHEEAQLAHRDLKPANLMINKLGKLKVADFGISGSVSNTIARATMAQRGPSGTPVYMSPQQAMGENPSVLDDIYSVGATLYELLTGKPPFFQGDINAQVRDKVPPTMTTRRKELGHNPDKVQAIPKRWETVVAECLAKDPAQRPTSARDLVERLGLLEAKPTTRPRKAPGGRKAGAATGPPTEKMDEAQARSPKTARPTEPAVPDATVVVPRPPKGRRAPKTEGPKTKGRAPATERGKAPTEAGTPAASPATQPASIPPTQPTEAPPTEIAAQAAATEAAPPLTGTPHPTPPTASYPTPAPTALTPVPQTVATTPPTVAAAAPTQVPPAPALPPPTIAPTAVTPSTVVPAPVLPPVTAPPEKPVAPAPVAPAPASRPPASVPVQKLELPKAKKAEPAPVIPEKTEAKSRSWIVAVAVCAVIGIGLAVLKMMPTTQPTQGPVVTKPSVAEEEAAKKLATISKEVMEEKRKNEELSAKLKQQDEEKAKANAEAERVKKENQKLAENQAKLKKEADEKLAQAQRELDARHSLESSNKLAKVQAEKLAADKLAEQTRMDQAKATAEAKARADEQARINAANEAKLKQEKAETEARLKTMEEAKLRAEAEAAEVKRIATMRGGVIVHVVPSTAKVRLNGVPASTVPAVFLNLPLGNSKVEIEADGYEPTTKEVSVTDDRIRKQFSTNAYDVALVRSTGTVALNSAPTAAKYSLREAVSGKELASGTTPANKTLPTGAYTVEFARGPFKTNVSLVVARGVTTPVEQALPFGQLEVTSEPPGVSVFSGGKVLGVTPFALEAGLGLYELECKRQNFRDLKTNAVVGLQTRTTLKLRLDPRAGPALGARWTNSLGMKFVPVGEDGKLLFAVWETRWQDFKVFTDPQTGSLYTAGKEWRDALRQETEKRLTDPVVMVSWADATAFCEWLTKYERKNGMLENQVYRLPMDAEWSLAAGVPLETGNSPEEKDIRHAPNVYPWGKEFPPPSWAGNYGDEYSYDNFAHTAPVGQFRPNALGIYDLGGNVWEWCADEYAKGTKTYVLRGGSWQTLTIRELEAGNRDRKPPGTRDVSIGFRVVLEVVTQ